MNNLHRQLSDIVDQENYNEDGDSISGDEEYQEYVQKQNKEIMNQVRARMMGAEDEELKEDDDQAIMPMNDEMKQEILEELDDEYETMYKEVKQNPNQYIKLVPKNELQMAYIYEDDKPFLEFRKYILIKRKQISALAMLIVKNPAFELLTISIILFNSVMLAIDDPTTDVQTAFADAMDNLFLVFYTLEAVLKIVGMGFLFNQGSYLRDTWNILDFLVIVTAYLPYLINSNSVNLSSLRAFRVLRPLRTVSSIKSLRTILLALFASIAQLRDTMVVLLFFYTIFAIAGLQLFSGYLKRRCFTGDTGITQVEGEYDHYPPYCTGDSDCASGFICGKQLANPFQDLISFDTFGWSFLQVFIITTLEGWTDIQAAVEQTFSPFCVFYFQIVVIVGSFFLVNLTLAVIKLNFKPEKIQEELSQIKEEVFIYDYWQLRQLQLYTVEREQVSIDGYGVTHDNNIEIPMHIQRKMSRNQTQLQRKKTIVKKRVNFQPIRTAVYFSTPVNVKNIIKLQGIYGMGNVNRQNANQQRVSLQRKNSDSSDHTNSQMNQVRTNVDNILSEIESMSKPQTKSHRKSVLGGIQAFQQQNQQASVEGASDILQNSPHPDPRLSGFKRVEGGQKTLVPGQHRSSVESQESGDSGPQNQLDLPVKLENFRQLSFNVQHQKPKIQAQGTFSEDEFDSVNLSELNTISDEELDARLEEMDIFIEDKGPRPVSGHKISYRERMRQKRQENKRIREQLKAERDGQLTEDEVKLKSTLFLTKFYPVLDLADLKYQSENDVLASKLMQLEERKRQEQEEQIRKMKTKLIYNFKNQRIMNFKTSSSSSKTNRGTTFQATSKMRSSEKHPSKIYRKVRTTNLRRIKPIFDDQPEKDYPVDEKDLEDQDNHYNQDNQDEEQEDQQKSLQLHKSLKESKEEDLLPESQRMKKTKARKEEKTFEYFLQKFKQQDDCVVDLTKLSLVIKDKKEEQQHQQPQVVADFGEMAEQQPQINNNEQPVKVTEEEGLAVNADEGFLSPIEKEMKNGLFYHEYNQIKSKDLSDAKTGKLQVQTSLEDVIMIPDYQYYDPIFARHMNIIATALNYKEDQFYIWLRGPVGVLLVIQRKLRRFVESSYFEGAMNLAVALNTVILALDGILPDSSSDTTNTFNFAFTIIFTIELGLKVLGLGVLDYIRDTMNVFDAIIVALSLVELFFLSGGSGKSSLSAFRSVRIFRAFRVLRVTKLMRSLKFMGFLISVLGNAFSAFMYILLLLVIFIFIFVLLGMAFFGGLLTHTPSRQNFDDLQNSFLVVFQVLTLENWNSILYELLLQDVFPLITILYLVFWIMIGNYVFLNLFMAILLEYFEEQYKRDKSDLDTNIEIGKDSVMDPYTTGGAGASGSTIKSNSKRNRTIKSMNLQLDQDDINKKKAKTQEFVYFSEPNLCMHSLNFFSQTNIIRRICYRIVKDGKFETLIFFMIFLTSVKLVIDTYIPDSGDAREISVDIDIFFAVFFTLECILKVIAFGFAWGDFSYLKESWNVLDFFIVLASLIDISVTTINLSFVKILRLLRTLRPLRFITHNRSMKILVSALLQSINGIFNVFIVVILVWIMFAILGINLEKNKLWHCHTPDDEVHYNVHADECPGIGGVWKNHQTNFDNIYNGLITLFVLTTLEGWPDLMYYFIDADEAGPIKGAQLQFSWYFVIFILFGSILLMNLFVGVILVNYHIAEEASKDSGLTKHQTDWVEVQKLIVQSNPNMAMFFPPENKFRALVFKIIKSRFFDPVIMTFIVFNIVTLALNMENASAQYDDALNNINLVFTAVFIAEALLKIIALGPVGYMRNGWNQFDFFVVMASILDIVLEFSGNSFISFLKAGPQLARVFRVLRVTRLFRLVKQFEGLQKLIETAIYSLPAMLNVIALLFLVYFIFSILGVFLYQDIKTGDVIDSVNNFQDFHHAFLLLFRCSTGENWFVVMFDTMVDGQGYNCVYFIIFILIQQYIMLNLFILIILDQYEINYFNQDNPLNRFQENENTFVEAWAKYATEDKGMKMSDKYLMRLMLDMEKPLGYELKTYVEQKLDIWKRINPTIATKENIERYTTQLIAASKKQVSTQIMKMNIYSESQGLVRYHQILFAFMKNYMWPKVAIGLTEDQLEKIMQKEDETQKRLRKKIIGAHYKDSQIVNPIVQFLFVSMSFMAFKRYGMKKKEQRAQLAALESKPEEYYSGVNSSNSSYAKEFEIEARDSNDSEYPSRPDYARTRYLALPNTEIYKQEACIVIDGSEDQNQEEEEEYDTNRIMNQYTSEFKKYLVENDDNQYDRSNQSSQQRIQNSQSKIQVSESNSRKRIKSQRDIPKDKLDKLDKLEAANNSKVSPNSRSPSINKPNQPYNPQFD